MSRRIRSIKPEILEDEKSAGLSSDAWRLWVSLWLLADDFGRVRGDARHLQASVFWACPAPPLVPGLLEELSARGCINRYTVRGQSYIEIVNWTKHQRIDNASKRATLPGPEEADEKTRRESPRIAAVRGSDLDLEREREKEEEAPPAPRAQARIGELPGKPNEATKRAVDRWRPVAELVLDALNAARKRVQSASRGISPSYDSLKHIADRLEAGKSAEDCLHVVEVCEAECIADAGSFKWFDAVTPFRPVNFERKSAAPVSVPRAPRRGPAPVGDFSGVENGVDVAHMLRRT